MTVPRKPPLQASNRLRVPRQRSGRPELLAKDAELRQPSRKATAARDPAARRPRWGPRRGREAALQMLYQWEVGRADIDSVFGTYWQIDPPGSAPTEETRAFAEQLARGTTGNLTVSDPLIAGEAEHWRLSRMALLDRLILRLAVYEFLHTDTPRAVVINEAIELAKKFSTDDSAKFINGVLDAIRRRVEMKGQ